ncbi:MAG: protein kinase [Pyrinomonadaceae bacterium]|nr:protein kinase [Pyrinomonadaceae bacterium]
MTTNEWQRIEELFHTTLQLADTDRADYLTRQCAGDETLRQEVESLVAAFESEPSFIQQPALSLGMKVLSDGLAGSLVGRSIGHYKVVKLLGKGGMGEVYLAEDSVLERPVALKFIANNLIGDEWAREQLMKEARAVARLENSNICAVYGVEETDRHNFIVMQYVDGETMASLLSRGPLGLERALNLAEQIISALSAAHARGIIHRDVKPQNIIVTADDQIKVLDFGLAKFVRQQQDAKGVGRTSEQTLTSGFVVGTVAYMSPEQTRGEELDCRSDLFSLGVVLHEMLGGQNPFLRQTDAETISAITADETPPLIGLPPGLPGGLERIVRKCLAQDRELRYETADQLLRDLRGVRLSSSSEQRTARQRIHLQRYAAAALALVCVLLAAAGFFYLKLSKIHTLAALPITNQSEDSALEYLSVGLTQNLSDKFSYLPRLKLRLPSAVPAGTNDAEVLVKVGRELKADAVLSGQIVKQGDALRLHLSLLDTADASQIWNGTFNLDAANLLVLQDDITREVASKLGLWLIGDEKRLLTKHQTDSQDALSLYMRGRYYWGLKRDRENIQTAIRLFERAIELDPSFAKAYTGLADSYVLITNVAYGPVPTKEAMDKARWNARQALDLDDALPEAHTSMGIIKLLHGWNWQEAEQEFARAIELDPEYAPARYWYSNLLAMQGRFDESIMQSVIAKGLDPYSPHAEVNYGRALYYSRRYDEAAAHFHKLLEGNPDYPQFLHMMGLVLLQQGRYEEAIATLEKLYSIRPLHAAAALGYAYGKAGRHHDALGILRTLDEFSRTEPIPPLEKALVYIGMGHRDEAFSMLEKVYEERFGILAYLTTDPLYDDLRPDPRFADLARRLNLTP